MKKVLILSDNAFLTNKLSQICETLKSMFAFEFRISPESDHENFSLASGEIVKSLHVKNELDDLLTAGYECILSLHCKQLFPPQLVDKIRCINIHPGYNPYNRGWYPQVFSILNEMPVGVTIHEIDNFIDHGPVIFREKVDIYLYDTSDTIYRRLILKELELLELHLKDILDGSYETFEPEQEGNVNLKADFNDLRKFDLNEVADFKTFYNRLRALSFEGYQNAYFFDENSNKKIFISLNVHPE